MSYILRYRSTRLDVWHWYWHRWLSGAWVQQFFIAISVSIYSAVTNGFSLLGFLLLFAVTFLLTVTAFAAWPQIAFKSQERVLEVNSVGWSTRIGDKSGSRAWREIQSVREGHGVVVITGRSGNALLVPASAFSNPDEQKRFLKDVRSWHSGHAV